MMTLMDETNWLLKIQILGATMVCITLATNDIWFSVKTLMTPPGLIQKVSFFAVEWIVTAYNELDVTIYKHL